MEEAGSTWRHSRGPARRQDARHGRLHEQHKLDAVLFPGTAGAAIAAKAGVGQRPSDKKAKRVLAMHRDGLSYRLIGRNVGLSKNTVMEIVRRSAARA